METNICFSNVSKSYSKSIIFNDISYVFSKSIYHLTGQNGTGKSTLLRMMVGLETPDSGLITLNNQPVSNASTLASRGISYIPDNLDIYPFLTGKAFLNWILQLNTSDRLPINSIVESFKLKQHLETKFSDMSLGTKKKFLVATAFIGTPKFIVLDEPMNGLDDEAQNFLIKLLAERAKYSGIILTSHDEDKVTALQPQKLLIIDKTVAAQDALVA